MSARVLTVILTDERIAALNAARSALDEIESDCANRAWDAPTEPGSGANPQDYGRLAEAASVAGDLIFNVLNTAGSYVREPISKHAMHNWGAK